MKRHFQVLSVGLIAVLVASNTLEAGFFEGHIVPHFQNPSLQGYVAGSGFYNNTSSARYSIFGSDTVASIQWGSAGFSQANFFANQNVSTPSDTVFELGRLTFANGTSSLESLIFGATLVLDFIPTGSSQSVDTLYLSLGIGTTLNGVSPRADADYISLAVLDRAAFVQEGLGATFIVYGSIVGDPYFLPSGIEIDPDSITRFDPNDPTQLETLNFPGSGIGNLVGFTGTNPAVVPEPSSFALLAMVGLACVAFGSCRRRRASR